MLARRRPRLVVDDREASERITREQIEHFFVHYKDLEPGKWAKLMGWGDVAEAHRLIADAIARARG